MNILLTGGTGYIGSALLRALTARGHQVTAAVRSAEAAETVRAAGAHPEIGDLADAAWVEGLAAAAAGVAHTAELGPDGDDAWLDALLPTLERSGAPYVHTGGVWSWGDNLDISEDAPLAPPALTAWRGAREERVLALATTAVLSPAIVHGGGGGIPNGVIAGSRDRDGAVTLVGDGSQHWATVHVDDLAGLYVLALEQRVTGRVVAASGHNPTVREIGEAAAGPGGTVRAESADDTRARLGTAFADALLLDQAAYGSRARSLGWTPTRPALLDELRGAARAAAASPVR